MRKRMFMEVLTILVLIVGTVSFTNRSYAGVLPSTPDPADENKHYFVGLGNYDVWKASNGKWTNEVAPGMTVDWNNYIFEFDFPGRKILDVTVVPFYINMPIGIDPARLISGEELFKNSRYGEGYNKYNNYITDQSFEVRLETLNGKNTDSVSGNVWLSGTLSSPSKLDLTEDGDFAEGVEGYRYYFPILYTITLEPLEGQAIIKHFTKDGRSLDGIDGFRDYTRKLVKGEPYYFEHAPETSKYKYVGYKKSTKEPPTPGGTPQKGNPDRFQYDGSFKTYYAYFYYDPVNEGECPGGNCEPPPPAGSCSESPSTSIPDSVMDPQSTGTIKADSVFDVLQGIPTSESLNVRVHALEYLYMNKFTKMVGQCTYQLTVTKTYNLEWEEEVDDGVDEEGSPKTKWETKTRDETVTKSYTIKRDFSYWQIDNLEVYKIDQSIVNNYALPSGSVTLTPTGYQPPTVETKHSTGYANHIKQPTVNNVDLGSETVYGDTAPDEDFTSEAESAVEPIRVKNDYLCFRSDVIMSDTETIENGPDPGKIPAPRPIEPNVLFGSGYMIDSNKGNMDKTPSDGTIFYVILPGNINGGSNQNFPVKNINPVTVHTPVVNYSSASDDREHNQKTIPNFQRMSFILDRPFTVTIPTSGRHVDYPGYGNRDYAKYVRTKQVAFPFDVYHADRTVLYPKGTWIDIPVVQLTAAFYLPVWVDEGNYEIRFRTIAENAPSPFTSETNANTNLRHHTAEMEIPVEVIGRVYDFRITDIADYRWETVFRTQPGSVQHTGNYYWVGDRNIDGYPRGNRQPFTLPIRLGSHPDAGARNISVKTGYHFKFDLKTKGNMFGPADGIRIKPDFYFASKDGKQRQAVDLYYHSNEKKFIRIGSHEDKEKRYVILNARLRNVPERELTDTAQFLYDAEYAPNSPNPVSREQYVREYISNASDKTWVGTYDWFILPQSLRTFVGNPNIPGNATATPQRALAADQKWYGEYSIPAAVYVVPKGTNLAEYGRTNRLNDKSPIFLKNGYIIVNFNIETIRNKDVANPHLQYIHAPAMAPYPHRNQWGLEGFRRTIADSYGNSFQLTDGDVIFYHGDQSSYDDFGSMGTH